MAVPEINFDALGKRRAFKLGFGALCALEEEFDLPFLQIMQRVFPDLTATELTDPEKLLGDVMNVRMTDLRAVFVAGLGQEATTDEVEAIIDDIGLDEAGMILRRAMTNDLGGGDTDKKPNPPKARRKR